MDGDAATRRNQRKRTRKDLLQAAARLARRGRSPNLEEIAAEALVSRATAYRYFPSVEALLAEAALDIVTPEPEALFAGKAGDDPVTRLEKVDAALDEVIASNEPALRVMLAHSLQQAGAAGVPPRQNRRSPLIAAALAPARAQFEPASFDLLQKALALVVGTEAMVVFKDVLQTDDAEARRVKRWAIQALVEAARKA
jgi:AcrR family transcriptional regulator